MAKAILATKKVICNNRERERPFNIDAVKKVLYHQQCLEENKAEIGNNVESFLQTWVYAYESKTHATSTMSYDISCEIFIAFFDVNIRDI